ncbi:MAG TPA: DUF4363 family protein [Ruminiclostridium sp.]
MRKINSNTKTIIFVACLLLVIIISGLLTLNYLNLTANKLEYSVKAASVSVSNKQWDSAEEQLKTFEYTWGKTKFGWAILLDHFEVDNIENSFIKSRKYVESKDFSSALAELEALNQYILHIPKKEGFSMENIL